MSIYNHFAITIGGMLCADKYFAAKETIKQDKNLIENYVPAKKFNAINDSINNANFLELKKAVAWEKVAKSLKLITEFVTKLQR